MSQVPNSKKSDAVERPSAPFIDAIRKMKHHSNSVGETTFGSAPARRSFGIVAQRLFFALSHEEKGAVPESTKAVSSHRTPKTLNE